MRADLQAAFGRSIAGARRLTASVASWLRRRWPDALAVVLLTLVFAVVFVLARKEPLGSDDCSYFEFASGKPAGSAHHRQRYALLATAWLAQALFGFNLTAYYAVPLVYGLGLVLSSYALGRVFMGVLPSSTAAVMLLGLPSFLDSISLLLPDIPAQFWLTLGLVLFLRAFTSKSPALPRAPVLGSALCFFLAASAKESSATTLLGLVAFPVAFARSKRHWKVFLLVVASTAAFELIQSLALWVAYGDPLYRVHAVISGHVPHMKHYSHTPGAMEDHIDWALLATRFVDATAHSEDYQTGPFGIGYWSLLFYSLPLAVVAAAWRRQRLLLAFSGFVLAAYATLTFPVVSLDPLIPIVRTKLRYFIVVLAPLPILVMAGWVCAVGQRAQSSPGKLSRAPNRLPTTPARRLLRDRSSASLIGRGWKHVATGLVGAVYAWAAYLSGASYLSHAKTVHNGYTQVADSGRAVKQFLTHHGPVKRVLGPKKIRAGAFSWGLNVPVLGRSWRYLRGSRAPHRFDLLLAEHSPRERVRDHELMWQRVGKSGGRDLYYFSSVGDLHHSGRYEMLAANEHDMGHLEHARVKLRLRLESQGARPRALRLVVHHERGHPKPQRLRWQRSGKTYRLHATTRSFSTRGLEAVTLELATKGHGQFRLTEHQVRVIEARHR